MQSANGAAEKSAASAHIRRDERIFTMTDSRRIEKQKEEIQRLREKTNSLQDENTALKKVLQDKDTRIAELEKELDSRASQWEKHLTETAEAIEEAAEAKLAFEQAKQAADDLRRELKQILRSFRQTVTGKAV